MGKMGTVIKYTPAQQAILDVLRDGNRHPRSEIHEAVQRGLNDPLATEKNMHDHLYALRKNLRVLGQNIVCEIYQMRIYYRHVILLPKS